MAMIEQGGTLGRDITPRSQDKKNKLTRLASGIFNRKPKDPLPSTSAEPKNGYSADRTESEEPDHTRAQISEVLYGSPYENHSPIVYSDMETIHAWRQHPDVFGHIYPRIKDDPELDDELKRVSQWNVYNGSFDASGNPTHQEDVVHFKVVNPFKDMLAVATLRLAGVPFIHDKPRNARVGYMEQVMRQHDPVGTPDEQKIYKDKRIGTALGIVLLDYAFYECTRYQGGRGVIAVEASTIEDRTAEGFDKNALWLRRLGFRENEDIVPVKESEDGPEIPVQPWRVTLEQYEIARVKAVEFIRTKQPEFADYLEKRWPALRQQLRERTARLPEGKSLSY